MTYVWTFRKMHVQLTYWIVSECLCILWRVESGAVNLIIALRKLWTASKVSLKTLNNNLKQKPRNNSASYLTCIKRHNNQHIDMVTIYKI